MTRFELSFYKHLHFYRRLTQWLALFFIFLVPFLNRHGYHQIIGTFYSIRIGQMDLMDPALMFQTIVLSKQVSWEIIIAGMVPIILAFLLGKVFCSWVCPYNLLAEYVAKWRKRLFPKKKYVLNRNPKAHLYWTILGAIFTILMILGIPLITLVSFPGLLSSQAADLILNGTLGVEIFLVLVVLLLEFFVAPHFWCKYACPVGATLALFRNKHTLHIHFDPQGCTCDSVRDLSCNQACPLGLDPRHADIYPYCYNCGECIYSCHQHHGKSLSFSFRSQDKKNAFQPNIKNNIQRSIKEVNA